MQLDNKLFRCEVWAENEGGLIVKYIWSTSPAQITANYLDHWDGHKLYKIHQCSLYEQEAWEDGFNEGKDYGVVLNRFNDESVIDFEVKELFICGICNKHRPSEEKSGEVVYVGLYGTEWQVCTECKGLID